MTTNYINVMNAIYQVGCRHWLAPFSHNRCKQALRQRCWWLCHPIHMATQPGDSMTTDAACCAAVQPKHPVLH